MRIQNLFLTQTKAKTIAQRTSSKQIERTIKLENKARNLNARFKRKSYYRIRRIAQGLENAEQKNSFIKTSRESAKLIMIECEIPRKHWRIILDKVELWAKYNFAGNKTKLKEIERTISNSIG